MIEYIDAEGLLFDYYSNVLSWSSKNIVAFALTNNVYLQKLTNEFTFDKSKTLNLASLKEEHGKAY